jgi:uncharacterized protein (DUF608 family)
MSDDEGALFPGAAEPAGRGLARRTVLRRALGAAGAALAFPQPLTAAAASGQRPRRDGLAAEGAADWRAWDAPEAAYTRQLGAVPNGICNRTFAECATGVPNPAFRKLAGGLSVPGLGIPLGGVGAGSFMINQCGTFGPWNMGGEPTASNWEQRILPQAAFHVREEAERGGPATVKTLAVPHHNIAPQRNFGSVLPAWRQLQPGDGAYSALFPFGWIRYGKIFEADIEMRFWSPIVARDDRPTSMPVAYFDMVFSNPTDHPLKLSTMFTFPNAAPFEKSTRTGLYAQYDFDAAHGVGAVTLGADAPANSPDSHDSQWTIAAIRGRKQALSYVTSWNGAGDGADIYGPFTASGALPNGKIDESNSAGALAVTFDLPPGEHSVVRFALAWDFPQTYFGADPARRAVWMRRYTGFLGGRRTAANAYAAGSYPFRRGFTIARDCLTAHGQNLAAVEGWWKPIATGADYRAWLRSAALNELYHTVFNTAFWEAGLVSSTIPAAGPGPRPGSADPNTHLAFIMDSGSGGTTSNEIDVDSYGYLVWSRLFPSQEKGRIQPVLEMIAENRVGRATKAIWPESGPFVGAHVSEAPPVQGSAPPAGVRNLTDDGDPFRDCPHKVIYRAYALWRETGDAHLVKAGYAPMLKTLRYTQAFRPKGSHLPLDPPTAAPANTYDQMPVDGHGVYNSQLYVLSLQILAVLTPIAMRMGVPEATDAVAAELEQDLALAKAEFETIFWNPATGRYRFCDGSGGIAGKVAPIPESGNRLTKPVQPPDSVFVDAFYAQGIAMQLGLPSLIDLQRARRHLNQVMDIYLSLKDNAGRLTGAPCLLDPQLRTTPMSANEVELGECWVGSNYMLAAAAIRVGKKTDDRALAEKGLQLARIMASRTYGDPNDGFAFATPECWFVDADDIYRYPAYSRARAVWQVLDALAPIPAPGRASMA